MKLIFFARSELFRIAQQQKGEIERLKSRITILNGKFNAAIYGLPEIGPYRERLIADSLLDKRELQQQNKLEYSSFPKFRETLFDEIRHFPGAVFIADGNAFSMGMLDDVAPARDRRFYISLADQEFVGGTELVEHLRTDPLTALRTLSDRQLSAILCGFCFLQMTPSEQRLFIDLAVDKLTQTGMLRFVLPDLANPQVATDLYWCIDGIVRPYSLTMVRDQLESKSGKMQITNIDASLLRVWFQKA